MKALRKFLLAVLFSLLGAGLFSGVAGAQGGGFPLTLTRDWGYGGFGGEIEGRFTIKVKGEQPFTRVIFYLDETVMAEVTEAPFRFQFETGDYPSGEHVLWAEGVLPDGSRQTSEKIRAVFLSKEEANAATRRLLFPLLGVIALSLAIAAGVSALATRRNASLPEGAPRNYGLWGGTICPHCRRPYAMHFYGLNLLTHRFDRCPHCGRWGLVRRQPIEALREAEEAERRAAARPDEAPPTLSEEEILRKQLDESRYED